MAASVRSRAPSLPAISDLSLGAEALMASKHDELARQLEVRTPVPAAPHAALVHLAAATCRPRPAGLCGGVGSGKFILLSMSKFRRTSLLLSSCRFFFHVFCFFLGGVLADMLTFVLILACVTGP